MILQANNLDWVQVGSSVLGWGCSRVYISYWVGWGLLGDLICKQASSDYSLGCRAGFQESEPKNSRHDEQPEQSLLGWVQNDTLSLLPHSVSQSKLQGQHSFKG